VIYQRLDDLEELIVKRLLTRHGSIRNRRLAVDEDSGEKTVATMVSVAHADPMVMSL